MATGFFFFPTYLITLLPLQLPQFNVSAVASSPPDHRKESLTPASVACLDEWRTLDLVRAKVNQQIPIGEAPDAIKTVVIDAGHGGHDPGCHGAGHQEKHLALAIAKKLAEGIRTAFPSVKVILTRDRDVFVPLYERAELANRNHADLFISIHCNYLPGSAATHGTETYVMGLHTAEYNLQVAKRENDAILLEDNYQRNYDFDPNSAEGHILFSMVQHAYLQQSLLFGELTEDQLRASAGRRSRGVKQAGFVVLKATAMPSVLIETGFLSNAAEEQFLASASGQDKIAQAILQAFAEYKAKVEGQPAPLAAAFPAAGSTSTDPVAIAGPAAPAPRVVAPRETPAADRRVAPTPNAHGPVPPSSNAYAAVPPAKSTASASNLLFYVQVSATPNLPNVQEGRWQNLPYAIQFVQEDQLYKGRTIGFAAYDQANNARNQLRAAGFADAFLIVYHQGRRIGLAEAKKMLGIP